MAKSVDDLWIKGFIHGFPRNQIRGQKRVGNVYHGLPSDFTTEYPQNIHGQMLHTGYPRIYYPQITHRLSSDITHGQILHTDLPQIYYPQITHGLSTSITHYLSTDVYPRNIHGTYPRILPTDYPQLFYPRNCHRDFTHELPTEHDLPLTSYPQFFMVIL